jgi:hypothetical protein
MKRKDDPPRAYKFRTYTCGDPECGLHFILSRKDGTDLAEMVVGKDVLFAVLSDIRNVLGIQSETKR